MTARRPNFDTIARPYRMLEYITLGRALERTRMAFLPELMQCRNALVLGDGDGRFLERLLATNGAIRATAIDSSAMMLQLLHKRCAAFADRLETYQVDALESQPTSFTPYDLVVTHFFLDCFTQSELKELIARTAPYLSPQALWVVSDFHVPTGWLRLPASLLVRSLYLAFRLLTGLRTTQLPDHKSALSQAGFERLACRPSLAGLLKAELWRKDSTDISQNL